MQLTFSTSQHRGDAWTQTAIGQDYKLPNADLKSSNVSTGSAVYFVSTLRGD